MTGLVVWIIVALLAVFWWEGMASKELARQAGARACREGGVQFLDDTVVLTKLRVRRGMDGGVNFYRLYGFEFSSDGAYRYNGVIHMLGRQVLKVEMDPYRSTDF